jgi:hypothetical protein
MHARRLNAVESADGAGQFAFQCPKMVDVLNETGGAERVRFVENLVANAAAFGRPPSASFMRSRATLSLGTRIMAPSLLIW